MKNSLLSPSKVESLRAQVRQLRENVAELEERLAAFENPEQDDQWGIWPYCHVVSSWNFGREQLDSLQRKLGRWSLMRHNKRCHLQNDHPLGEMRLT